MCPRALQVVTTFDLGGDREAEVSPVPKICLFKVFFCNRG